MAVIYKHGTYGEFAESIAGVATQSGTLAVYVGTAPVNLIRGYDELGVVNGPVYLKDWAAVQRTMGYSSDWSKFTLCEAFKAHFNNPAGNAAPIVVINVLDPAVHKKGEPTTQQLTFTNGRATLLSDTIILDTFALAEKVEGVDYTLDYNYTTGEVIVESAGAEPLTGSLNVTYSEVDLATIDQDDIIGGVTAAGVYSGLGCVGLIYPELNFIPNVIAAPGWSDKPEVFQAMITAGTKINGHWNAFVVADLTLEDTDTIEKAITWQDNNGYRNERAKTYWPQGVGTDGNIYHLSTMAVWRMLLVDAENDGIPMETPSNKAVPLSKLYFGEGSANRGFDQNRANDLNEKGISTAVFWGGQWGLWGGHTSAYEFNAVTDKRVIFDNNIRMMMYISNSFQERWALTIDQPMTVALAESIKVQEQEKLDALVARGALIGEPVVLFQESENSTDELAEGNFVWFNKSTPTPQFKSGTLRVAYTDAGFSSYFGEEV